MKQLKQRITLEWVGMAGSRDKFTTLTLYDQDSDRYYDPDGREFPGRYLDEIRAGKYPWLQVRKES